MTNAEIQTLISLLVALVAVFKAFGVSHTLNMHLDDHADSVGEFIHTIAGKARSMVPRRPTAIPADAESASSTRPPVEADPDSR